MGYNNQINSIAGKYTFEVAFLSFVESLPLSRRLVRAAGGKGWTLTRERDTEEAAALDLRKW